MFREAGRLGGFAWSLKRLRPGATCFWYDCRSPHIRFSRELAYRMAILGAHMSMAGGYYKAVEAAKRVGCDCVQLFTLTWTR